LNGDFPHHGWLSFEKKKLSFILGNGSIILLRACVLRANGPNTWFPKANGPKFHREICFLKESGLKTWFPSETQVLSILKFCFLGQIGPISPLKHGFPMFPY
jgi:hypothetical protein